MAQQYDFLIGQFGLVPLKKETFFESENRLGELFVSLRRAGLHHIGPMRYYITQLQR